MSQPRLLHVLESTTAGVRRYVTTLLQHRPANWEVSVACPRVREAHFGDVGFVEDVKRLGVPIHFLGLRRSIGPADAKALHQLLDLIRRERFDLIHTHSSKAGFLGRLAARAAGIPVIHTPNGLFFLERKALARRFYLALERLAGRMTSHMVAVSAGERDVIAAHRLIRPERLRVIENGIDVAQVRAMAQQVAPANVRELFGPTGSGPLVGAVGRMARQKDPLTFVHASKRVLESMPNAHFVWCGDGELREATQQLAKEVGVPLTITGHREDVWPLMRQFDVFVLSSLYEGLPFTLLEAMALGVPVVATDVVGTRDVLGGEEVSWLTPPSNPDSLAQAICTALAQSDEARRRAEAAARLVETRFTVDRMVAEHRRLCGDVLHASGRQVAAA